jgi:hypothetical protein
MKAPIEINVGHVASIVDIFHKATYDEINAGINWYTAARESCESLSVKHNIPFYVVVAVVASLSPNNRWERNLENADRLIAAFIAGDEAETVKCSTYHAMRAKAWNCLEIGTTEVRALELNSMLLDELKGQKITAFYQNISGTSDAPTIDGHAANIARGMRVSLSGSKLTITKRQYLELQVAYVEAAHQLEHDGYIVKGYEVQAVTWVAWRRIHNI